MKKSFSETGNNDVRVINKKNSSYLEIRNGLLGIVIPKENTFDPVNTKNALAPIQSIIYHDGTYSDDSPNYLKTATPAIAMNVNIATNTSKLCIVIITYTFNKSKFIFGTQTYKGGDEGKGFYKTTIRVEKNSKSILIEEESDYDISYEFKISTGLQPDRARYRGWNSSSIENGYEPSGIIYRPQDKRQPLDATIDLHYNKERSFPYLSLWDPLGGEINTGRYWQVFNNTAAENANLLGFFQGKPSRLLGATSVGPHLILSPKEVVAVIPNEKNPIVSNIASIQINITRRGPDNSWYPKKRFQWALFVTTKADLLPPDQYQPIGKEMNNVSGLGAKIDAYAKTPAIMMPAFFEGAIYMPAKKIQELINQVKTNPGFSGMLNSVDSYFKTITDAWRYPDSASSAIKNLIKYGEDLKDIFKNGDGVHEYNTQYWKGGFRFKDKSLEISCIFADKSIVLTPSQKDALMQVVRMMARIEWDNDNVPFTDSAGVNFGPANMAYQYQSNGHNFFSMLFAKDPEFAKRADEVAANTRANILSAIYDNGASFGTPHYTQATIDPILFGMLQLKQAGVVNLFTEQKTRLHKFIDFYSSLLTPPSVRFSGYRKLISFGDGSEESAVTFGLLASGFVDSDSLMSKNLSSIFQHGAPRASLFGHVALAIDLSKNYVPVFNSATSNYAGYLSHLRSNINSENETAVWILNGNKFFDHRNDDAGEVAIYALKAPLSLSRSCFYYPSVTDARMRSVVVPEDMFPEWNKNNDIITERSLGNRTWPSSDQIEFAKLGNSSISFSQMKMSNKEWYRRIVMINVKEDQPVIVFYDSVNNNIPNIWSFPCMSDSSVTTPVGLITPRDSVYKSVGGYITRLPPSTPEKNLNSGLNKFSFTGQRWTKKMHSSQGINWDLYSLSNDATSFNVSQWTNNWQNSQEAAEFSQTNGKSYSETQQILRIKSTEPFLNILLPYFKGTEPYKNNVHLIAPGKISIDFNNGKLLITSSSYFYTATDKTIACTFTNQPLFEKGIGINNGIAEIEIINNDIKIRVHGNSGKRIIKLPFAVEMIGKNEDALITAINKDTQITIDYKSNGLDLLSTEQGFKEYNFKKKM